MAADTPTLMVRGLDRRVSSITAEFDISRDAPADFAENIFELTQRFVALGMRGGFAAPGLQANISPPHVAISDPGHVVTISFVAEGIEIYALQILRNMAYWLQTLDVVVHTIRVFSDEEDSRDWVVVPPPDDENEEDVYPQMPEDLPFEVEWEDPGATRVRRCLIEYDRSLEASDVLASAEWVEPWFDVVEWGGFALPAFIPYERHSTRGSVTQFDETTIEVVVFRYFGSEALWVELLNLLSSYCRQVWPITRVTIE
jgi:hypothetical protein